MGWVRAGDATNVAQPSAVAGTAAKKARRARDHAGLSQTKSSEPALAGDGPAKPGAAAARGAEAAVSRVSDGRHRRGLASHAVSCAASGDRPDLLGVVGSGLSHHRQPAMRNFSTKKAGTSEMTWARRR